MRKTYAYDAKMMHLGYTMRWSNAVIMMQPLMGVKGISIR